jgi:hypothetical protein
MKEVTFANGGLPKTVVRLWSSILSHNKAKRISSKIANRLVVHARNYAATTHCSPTKQVALARIGLVLIVLWR